MGRGGGEVSMIPARGSGGSDNGWCRYCPFVSGAIGFSSDLRGRYSVYSESFCGCRIRLFYVAAARVSVAAESACFM